MKNQPRVSIIITTFNRLQYLKLALESLCKQTSIDFEVLIMDDGDGADGVVSSFNDRRFKYTKNKSRIGQGSSINSALNLIKSEYVCILDDDDLYTEDSIQKRLEVIESNPKIGYVFSAGYLINHSGEIYQTIYPCPENMFWNVDERLKNHIRSNDVLFCSAMIRTEALRKAGEFDTHPDSYCRDWDMWLRIYNKGFGAAYINRPLAYNRIHDATATSNYYNNNCVGIAEYRMFTRFFKLCKFNFVDELKSTAVECLFSRMVSSASGKLSGFNISDSRIYLDRIDQYINSIPNEWDMRKSQLDEAMKRVKKGSYSTQLGIIGQITYIKDKLRKLLNLNEAGIVIYGTGISGQFLFSVLSDTKYKVVGVIDSNEEKIGKLFANSIKIESPEALSSLLPDVVLLATSGDPSGMKRIVDGFNLKSIAFNDLLNKDS